jgi:urease accessory protein
VRLPSLPLFAVTLCGLLALADNAAWAHHVMGGKLPATLVEGTLAGLGHPIIGIDHLAAVVAVGCLAAAHRLGALLLVGYVLAQVAGAALHVRGTTVPAAELAVALSVIALGAVLILRRSLPPVIALGLFVLAGSFHGYALAESIIGAEPAPLSAYFVGFAVIQTLIALAAMAVARITAPVAGEHAKLRLIGAGIVGLGIGTVATQLLGA